MKREHIAVTPSWLRSPEKDKEEWYQMFDTKLQSFPQVSLTIKDIASLHPSAVRDANELEKVFRRMIFCGKEFIEENLKYSNIDEEYYSVLSPEKYVSQEAFFQAKNERRYVVGSEDFYPRPMYKDFSDLPLLTLEQDLELGKIRKNGAKARKELFSVLKENQMLDSEDLQSLKKNIQDGIAAQDSLFHHNIGLIIHEIKKLPYFYREKFSFEELEIIGGEGLAIAITRYNPDYRRRFCTYATNWIKKVLFYYVRKNLHTMSVAVDTHIVCKKIKDAGEYLRQTLGREPALGEIAEVVNMKKSKVFDLIMFEQAERNMVYLDKSINEDPDDSMSDILGATEEPGFEDVDVRDFQATMLKSIRKLFPSAELTDEEIGVLYLRLLFLPEQKTVEDIGKSMKITSTHVMQVLRNIRKKFQESDLDTYEKSGDPILAVFKQRLSRERKQYISV